MRKYFVMIIALLVMLMGGAVMAQDTPTVFCGSLSQADCDLITQSAEAMQTVKSAGFGFHLEMDLSNIPDSKTDHLNFRMTGNGAYKLDSEGLGGLLLSPGELTQQMDKLPQFMEDVIRAISAEGNFVMFFSDDFAAALGQSDTKLPSKAGFSARLIDGMAYMNLGKLAELDPKSDFPQGWFGFDLAAYYRQLLEQQTSGANGLTSALGSNFANGAVMDKYMTIERGEDIIIDGQNAAVFQSALDLGGFYTSEDFQTLLQQQLEQSGAGSISQADMEQAMQAIEAMMNGLTLDMTQSIGLDDHYTHRMGVSVNWTLDLDAISAATGANSQTSQSPMTIQVTFQGDLNQFNNAPEISVPEGAIIIPLDDLNNLGQSFGLPQ